MRIILLVFALVLTFSDALAQPHLGCVIDENGQVMAQVKIKDTLTNVPVYSNMKGEFMVTKSTASFYEISFYGYETRYLKASELKDTLQLTMDSRLLKGVTINSSRISSILNTENVTVLDYLVYDEYTLILYRDGSQKKLMTRQHDGSNNTFLINDINAKSLHEDCYGNVHILTKKEAFQIWIDDELHIVDQKPIDDFNTILAPCVALIDSTFIISSYSEHRQKYTLAKKRKGDPQFKPFFSSWDKQRTVAAEALYYEIIAMYYAVTDPTSNIILNNAWSGKMIELAFTDTLVMMIGFYEKNIARPTFVQSFKHNKDIMIFDVAFSTLYTFDKNGKELHQTPLQTDKNALPESILQDKATLKYYALDLEKGIYSISSINTENGAMETIFTLTEAPFAENIQVFDGRVYFLSAKEGYRKLYSTNL